ncbi:hypothetical protein FBU30_007885 [Linnemannia zychae]|nr:hypothetical protein FBU30_007885 [Linnemannia zychae]
MSLPPEIQFFILQSISQHDLTQVALVNKAWNAAVTPLLWKSIHLLSRSQANTYLKGQETHTRHLHYVETFQTRLLSSIRTMFDTTNTCFTPRLRTLDIMVPTRRLYLHSTLDRCSYLDGLKELRNEGLLDSKDDGDDDDVFGDKSIYMKDQELLLLNVITRNPQLETFKLALIPDNLPEFLMKMSSLLPRLQHLTLFSFNKRHKPSISLVLIDAFLRHISHQLQTATIGSIDLTNEPETGYSEQVQTWVENGKDRKHLSLKLLRFYNNIPSTQATVLVPFLQGCNSHLIKIEEGIEHMPYWIELADSESLIPVFTPILQGLSGRRIGIFKATPFLDIVEQIPALDDAGIASKISSFNDIEDSEDCWGSINLSNTNASWLTAKAIVDCCHIGLTSLNVARCQGIKSEDIQSILSKAVHLRCLESNAPSVYGHKPDPVLLAFHVIQSSWVCTWLVRLNIHIGGIPRPDIKVNEGGRPVKYGEPLDQCTIAESHAIQKKIYHQISQLTLLEELYLGYTSSRSLNGDLDYDVDKVQRNCLEMTLESGLYLLSGLKSMRVLSVAYMAHKIEAPELDWMQANWPDFYLILGILFRPYPENKTWSSQYNPAWRKMMHGRGLSYA